MAYMWVTRFEAFYMHTCTQTITKYSILLPTELHVTILQGVVVSIMPKIAQMYVNTKSMTSITGKVTQHFIAG